jgi:hypothetical protein
MTCNYLPWIFVGFVAGWIFSTPIKTFIMRVFR